MTASIAALFRYPIKGFTPERRSDARLTPGGAFPNDRLYAVENGPSGFDTAAPAFIAKTKFTVLAHMADVARARTVYDDATGVIAVTAAGQPPLSADLTTEAGREAFSAWLAGLLGEEASGPLKMLQAPGYRFLDHPLGHVSIINLASVRDLEAKLGRPLDPLRFRANLYVEGWEPWVENGWAGREITLGTAKAKVFKPIVRCAATDVDPATAARDTDLPKALFDNYGHVLCGIYIQITEGGDIAVGDAIGVI